MEIHMIMAAKSINVFCGKIAVNPVLDLIAAGIDHDCFGNAHRAVGMDVNMAVEGKDAFGLSLGVGRR